MSKIKNLNVLYYITEDRRHTREYGGKPFYINYPLSSNETKINQSLVKSILEKDQIDTSIIDDYRYLNKKKNGLIKIYETSSFPIESDELILQIHLGKKKDPDILELENLYYHMKIHLKELENKKDLNKNQRKENIDFFFLYASPLLNENGVEQFKSINYRSEILNLYNMFKASKQELNCVFECSNEKMLRDALIKQPKILHISAHGFFDQKRIYSLHLEDKGILKRVDQDRLKQILSSVSDQLKNIDLVFVSTCYSETLGKLFLEYGIKNVIYIQGMNPISDKAAVNFSKNFYREIINGNDIKSAFIKSQNIVQSDRDKESFNLKKCCCNHWHNKSECPLENNTIPIHKLYHIGCDCGYDEFSIHEENCKLLQKIKNDKAEDFFYFENYNNTIKICCKCCKPKNDSNEKMLPHGESFKFILKPKSEKDNKIIFPFRKEGKLHINKNCYIMDEKERYRKFSIVGRREQVKEIYDIVSNKNIDSTHFIIIQGSLTVGKQDFAESVCIYLLERKIINGFCNIVVKESKYELTNKVKELIDISNYSDGKYIFIVKIKYDLQDPLRLLGEILKEKEIENPLFYFIFLIVSQEDRIEFFLEIPKNKYKVIYLKNLDQKTAQNLFLDLCESYGYSLYLNINQLTELIELTKYSRKKINELVILLGKNNNFEKLKKAFESQDNNNINIQNEIRKSMEKDISKIYILLSIMPKGLPSSIIDLIEPNFKNIIKNEDEINIIYKEQDKNWYTIVNIYRKEIYELTPNDRKQKCICKIMKIYALLLFYYIQNTRRDIFMNDCNIHYHFDSYNNKGIWRSFDYENYDLYFMNDDQSDIYNNILNNDFTIKNKTILENHTENIFNLLYTNIDIITSLIKEKNLEIKEYLYQIILMLPTIYSAPKNPSFKNIITRCIHLCDKIKINNKSLMDSKQRLNLFYSSMKEAVNVDEQNFDLLGDQGMADAYFIKGLKNKDIKYFFKAIELYEKINDKDLNIQISYAYYEIGCLYFSEKNYQKSKEYLNKGLELVKENNDDIIKEQIYIELAIVMEDEYHKKEKYESFLKNIVNQSKNLSLIKEAKYLLESFNEKLEPDIIMLNSNPFTKKDNYSVLHNSIWANHNNQYYILQKIKANLGKDIRVKSIVLNEGNLEEVLKEKGKILIIQSDDFNEEGDMILENIKGEGEPLNKNKLKKLIPQKLNYEAVILCFIKSEKLIDLFKGRVKYLITFNDINIEDIDFDMLFKYNELSIEFIIHFIKNYTEFSIPEAFEASLNTFQISINNYKKSTVELINETGNYITLNTYGLEKSLTLIKKKQNKNDGKAIYIYPLLQTPIVELHYNMYTDDILHLIHLFVIKNKNIINIHSKNDNAIKPMNINTKTIIAFEIMRFFYRHQKYKGKIFYISNPKNRGRSLNEIANDVIGEKKKNVSKLNKSTSIVEKIEQAFIVINNFDKIPKEYLKENKYFFEEDRNFKFLIISKKSIDKIDTYEIVLKNEESNPEINSQKGKKKKKRKKKKSKVKAGNQNKDSIPFENTPNPKFNNYSLFNKKKTEEKNKEEKIKIKYDQASDFTIIDRESSSDSELSEELSKSEDSDIDNY